MDSGNCSARRLPENDIFEAFITAVNKLKEYRCEILMPAILQTENLQMRKSGSRVRIKEIDREIAELSDKNILITRLNTKGIIRTSEYTEQSNAISMKISTLRKERTKLLGEQDNDSVLSGLKRLNNKLTELNRPLTAFERCCSAKR